MFKLHLTVDSQHVTWHISLPMQQFSPQVFSLKFFLSPPISYSRKIYVHLGTGSAIESKTTEENDELWGVFFLQGL